MSNRAEGGEKREVRDLIHTIELRAAAEGSKSPGTIVGYAAVFNKFSIDLGYFREQMQRGAFAKALAKCDVRCLKNHETNLLLGRMSSGTLRMVEDEIGLRMECDLPDTSVGRDVAEEIRRGDIQGQSFAFSTGLDQWDWSGDPAKRTVLEVDELYDVGPVVYPAYEETSVAVRSFMAAREQRNTPSAPAGPPVHLRENERDETRLRIAEIS